MPDLVKKPTTEREWINDIIHNGNFRVVFQPIVDLQTGDILYFEALSRCPEDSPFPFKTPFAFPLSKRELLKLDRLAISKVIEFVKTNRIRPKIFLNCMIPNLPFLASIADEKTASSIVVEIDFSDQIFELSRFVDGIARLKRLGFALAVDDIGKYHVDEGLLKFIVPEYLKVDICVTREIVESMDAETTLKYFQQIASNESIEIIVEGIETAEQRDKLIAMDCTMGQGFFYARPSNFEDFRPRVDAAEDVRQAA